ncbi:hypothetical protein GN956_G18267 [Arapaima gigas]
MSQRNNMTTEWCRENVTSMRPSFCSDLPRHPPSAGDHPERFTGLAVLTHAEKQENLDIQTEKSFAGDLTLP